MSEQLPLRPLVFAVLLALNEDDLHGYAIMKEANRRLGGRRTVGPGTLYRTLKELRETEWIAHAPHREGSDPRRRYYRITPAGRRVAALEAARMAELVRAAVAGRLLDAEAVG